MKKRIIAFLLAMCMSSILITSASANEPDDLEMEENLSTAVASGESDSILRYGEREVVTELGIAGYDSCFTTPTGQQTGGYSFPAGGPGGAVYIDTAGGNNTTVSFSVAGKLLSVGVSLGAIVAPNSAKGIIVNIPADGHFYIVELENHFVFKNYKIDQYKYTEYISTVYVTKAFPNGVTIHLKQVR